MDGFWYATGRFYAASTGNDDVVGYTPIIIRVYPNRRSLEMAMKNNQDAVTTDRHLVMVGNNGRFYAVLTGTTNLESGGITHNVPPETVAQRLAATLIP